MFPTTQNSATNLSSMLADTKVQSSSAAVGKAFLKFDFKSGDFAFGRDLEDVTGETIIVNTYSIQHGWTLWANGTPSKVSAPFNESLPEAMPSIGSDSPSESRSFEARFLDDEDTILVFDSNSYGGRQGVDDLLSAIKSKALEGEVDFLFPKIQLDSTSYKAKQGSTVHNPKFNIIGWVNMEGDEQNETPAIEEKAPVKRRRAQ